MQLDGRILWLTEDAGLVRAQMGGHAIAACGSSRPRLQYGISTDAIIHGAACTLGFTKEVLGPYLFEHFKGAIRKGDIAAGGFQVIVGGDAYGSGSSREVAVVAHQGAGIRLVVAPSFQRIFQENMVYCGLPFTTDLSVLDALEAGEPVDLKNLAAELPSFFRDVAAQGGLLPYATKLLAGQIGPPGVVHESPRPMTCVEKIVARHAVRSADAGPGFQTGVSAVAPGDQVLCQTGFRGMHEYTAAMVMHLYEGEWPDAPIEDPASVASFEDHFVLLDEKTVPGPVKNQRLAPAQVLTKQMVQACEKHGIRLHGPGRGDAAGVCHRVVVERYGLPGSVIVLTDSHTPTAGVLNAFAFGVGSTAMAFALRTEFVPVTVPHTVRVVVHGDGQGILSPKDLILHLIGEPFFREEQWRTSPTDTCVVQFAGPGLERWNVDELSVLTNMTVEGGLMTGIVEPCRPLERFVRDRHPEVSDLEDRFVYPDEGAHYLRTLDVNLADVPLTVAEPGDSRNRAPLHAHEHVEVHNEVIASCTGGSLADLRAAAKILAGRRLKSGVRLTVTPSSEEVARAAEDEGILGQFRTLGAEVTPPGCGACIGNGPGIPRSGETTASTTNRNFERRMGAPGAVFLVSPAVAAATAVTGKLTDPRKL